MSKTRQTFEQRRAIETARNMTRDAFRRLDAVPETLVGSRLIEFLDEVAQQLGTAATYLENVEAEP